MLKFMDIAEGGIHFWLYICLPSGKTLRGRQVFQLFLLAVDVPDRVQPFCLGLPLQPPVSLSGYRSQRMPQRKPAAMHQAAGAGDPAFALGCKDLI